MSNIYFYNFKEKTSYIDIIYYIFVPDVSSPLPYKLIDIVPTIYRSRWLLVVLYNEQQIILKLPCLMYYLYDEICSDNLPDSSVVSSMAP